MKLIDLLNDLFDYRATMPEKLPKRIKFNGEEFVFKDGSYYYVENDLDNIMNHIDHTLDLRVQVEIIEEKPKKIEEIPFNNGIKGYEDIYHELENYNYRINDLIRAVNYLLEKESDK